MEELQDDIPITQSARSPTGSNSVNIAEGNLEQLWKAEGIWYTKNVLRYGEEDKPEMPVEHPY